VASTAAVAAPRLTGTVPPGPGTTERLLRAGAVRLLPGSDVLWTAGTWRPGELRTVTCRGGGVAVLGQCLAGAERMRADLERALETGRLEELTRWPGGYLTLVVRDGGLTAFADPAGQFPLYYRHADGRTVVGSSATAVAQAAGVDRRPDRLALAAWIFCPGVPALTGERSALDGVARLGGGRALDATAGGGLACWTHEPLLPGRHAHPAGAAQALGAALDAAVRARATAGRRVTADFSGGLDSTSVALLAARHLPELTAFTYHQPGAPAGDLEHARRYAALDGRLKLEVVCGTERTLPYEPWEPGLADADDRAGGPGGPYESGRSGGPERADGHDRADRPYGPYRPAGFDRPYGPHRSCESRPAACAGVPADEPDQAFAVRARLALRLERVAAAGGEVHLGGEGADALLVASPAYLGDLARHGALRRLARECRILGGRRHVAPAAVAARALRLARTPMARALRHLAHDLARPAARDPHWADAIAWWAPPGTETAWLTPRARADLAELALAAQVTPGLGAGDHAALCELRTSATVQRLLGELARGFGVWPQAPFLDNDVVRACLAVPACDRAAPPAVKPLLAAALADRVPAAVLARTTKGDYTGEDYRGARRNAAGLRAVLAAPRLADLGIVVPGAVAASLDRALAGSAAPFPAFNRLLAAEEWLRGL
jgi:asparagine synthase (glutamine-hydrolysing)